MTTKKKTPTTAEWRTMLMASLAKAMEKAGFGAEVRNLKIEDVIVDQTWGTLCGLVFFGSTKEVNERAGHFFCTWAWKHLRAMGVVGGYERQESISCHGFFAKGKFSWFNPRHCYNPPSDPITGFAVSYVYYPCAE